MRQLIAVIVYIDFNNTHFFILRKVKTNYDPGKDNGHVKSLFHGAENENRLQFYTQVIRLIQSFDCGQWYLLNLNIQKTYF